MEMGDIDGRDKSRRRDQNMEQKQSNALLLLPECEDCLSNPPRPQWSDMEIDQN